MDMNELYSVKALLDSGATSSFTDRNFVCLKEINTQTLSQPIMVFNVDDFPNEAGQISKVVDVLLCYKTHSKRVLVREHSEASQNTLDVSREGILSKSNE